MKVYLLRHGETAFNAEKRYLGRSDIPLSPEGVQVLERADFSPEKVYVSPLCRTAQTAAVLFPAARQIVVPDLREMDFGIFEGKNFQEMEDFPPYRTWVEGGCRGQIPGGESMDGFCGRVCAAFAGLMDQALEEGAKSLAIVAHGGTQMAVMERWALPRRDYFQWRGPHGGGFVLDGARWRREQVLQLLAAVQYVKA